MSGNISPIFSRVGDIQGGVTLTTAAADYTGNNLNNAVVFQSDNTNGGYLQRIRFKAIGTNVATVARVYITGIPVLGANNIVNPFNTTISAPSGLAGTGGTSGGTLATGTYYGKVQALDQFGGPTAFSSESSGVSVTGPTGNVSWTWTGSTGATNYRLIVGMATGEEFAWFETSTNSYSQVAPYVAGPPAQIADPTEMTFNNMFYGELSLPATTQTSTYATNEMDYNMGVALPPGYLVSVGLATTVAAGWVATGIGGRY